MPKVEEVMIENTSVKMLNQKLTKPIRDGRLGFTGVLVFRRFFFNIFNY